MFVNSTVISHQYVVVSNIAPVETMLDIFTMTPSYLAIVYYIIILAL